MKSILMSIKPKYVSMILNKNKTIEVRKRFPKDYVGWVYIYCTKDKKKHLYPVALLDKHNKVFKRGYKEDDIDNRTNYLNGKVVARFWVDKVGNFSKEMFGTYEEPFTYNQDDLLKKSCLTEKELDIYLQGKYGYAIHITKLEIFNKPKEISKFSIKVFPHGKDNLMTRYLTRAPQSWQFIEV